jgi:antitoxin component YwqK of YwqJK toxin-antitoxin module
MKPPKSDVPPNATERLVREYRQESDLVYLQIKECIFNGQVLGQRAYDRHGNLKVETPLKNGKKHGREYVWKDDGTLESVEPYVDGKLHGLAKQYGRIGKLIETYRCVHEQGLTSGVRNVTVDASLSRRSTAFGMDFHIAVNGG